MQMLLGLAGNKALVSPVWWGDNGSGGFREKTL